jgi:hypothetical protein
MSMKIIYLLVSFTLALSLNAMNDKELSIFDQIAKLAKNQENFCRKGFGSFVKSIRANDGFLCQGTLGGSLAMVACENYAGFLDSKCAQKARDLSITDSLSAQESLKTLNLSTGKYEFRALCDILSDILPDKKEACDKILSAEIVSQEMLKPGELYKIKLEAIGSKVKALVAELKLKDPDVRIQEIKSGVIDFSANRGFEYEKGFEIIATDLRNLSRNRPDQINNYFRLGKKDDFVKTSDFLRSIQNNMPEDLYTAQEEWIKKRALTGAAGSTRPRRRK